ncbi:hypothetical protein P2R12_05580 [Cytobacillus oceanisediminis]|uniref:hypothetical protein n=1 Tax=Cytobacillus oceanisediminis TaxID=665099 RepID=UPI0023DB77BA|nr:hypothetical protein [Cytobacillus oceanisediminis]MDF2036464.1 hypothetical protein [Cytobacillus oceanisediminis]
MKVVLPFAIAMLALTGCSALASDGASEMKWFETKEESIEYGLKEEKIKKEDIIGEVSENGETFIIYKKQLEEGLGVGVSSISEKDGQYAWYDPDQDVLVKNDEVKKYSSQISWGTETQSGKTFTIYTGVSDEGTPVVKTETGEVSPTIENKTGIYFYIEPTK